MLRILAVAAVAAASTHPSLAVSGSTVHGTHFHPRERVRVHVVGTSSVVRIVKANAAGTFTTTLPPRDPCNDTIVITAVGASGDSARMKVMPRACPPSNATP